VVSNHVWITSANKLIDGAKQANWCKTKLLKRHYTGPLAIPASVQSTGAISVLMIMLRNSHYATALVTAGWHPLLGSLSCPSSYPLLTVPAGSITITNWWLILRRLKSLSRGYLTDCRSASKLPSRPTVCRTSRRTAGAGAYNSAKLQANHQCLCNDDMHSKRIQSSHCNSWYRRNLPLVMVCHLFKQIFLHDLL